jgi:dolichol-phosphate mannosyltransferase
MPDTIIIIPTYNEFDNIAPLLRSLAAVPIAFDVLFVDDDSPDQTARAIRSASEDHSWVSLLSRSQKSGIASAYRDGFKYALKNGYQTIIQMDADLSHDPQMIPELLRKIQSCDIVIGSRYISGGGVTNWDYKRTFLSRFANLFARFLLHKGIHDWTSGYKCFRRAVLETIDYSSLKSKGYAFQVEMINRCFMHRLRIVEVPIIFHGRVHEHSKMSFAIVVEAFLRVLYMAFTQMPTRVFNRRE